MGVGLVLRKLCCGAAVRRLAIGGIGATVALAALPGVHGGSFDGTGTALERAVQAAFDAVLPDIADALAHDAEGPATAPSAASAPADRLSAVPPRWRRALQAFAAADRARPPATGGVVFIGSSSIGLWHGLESRFPAHNIVRRGLGGARMSDCAAFVDRLVLPHRPRLVVVYAGDNDIADGVAPEAVLAASADLARQVHSALPQTRIAFVSVKPSPRRAALQPAMQRTNALLAAWAATDARLATIDVYTPMVDTAGHVRPELFAADALHLNAAGYAVWNRAIAPHLD